MLFRETIEPCCAYCRHAVPISREAAVCLRRGIVCLDGACFRFRYDPLKRVPEKPKTLPRSERNAEEFTL